jgi:hypothetical protein
MALKTFLIVWVQIAQHSDSLNHKGLKRLCDSVGADREALKPRKSQSFYNPV